MINMSEYYSKIRVCDYCKDLDCEIVMSKTELGVLCPMCSKNYETRHETSEQKEQQMAIEIETY